MKTYFEWKNIINANRIFIYQNIYNITNNVFSVNSIQIYVHQDTNKSHTQNISFERDTEMSPSLV